MRRHPFLVWSAPHVARLSCEQLARMRWHTPAAVNGRLLGAATVREACNAFDAAGIFAAITAKDD